MATTRNERKRKAKETWKRMNTLTRDDHAMIQAMPRNVLSKHKAKLCKKECRAVREDERWQPGFRGDVPTTGKELGPDYIGRFRVRDGTRSVREKAWMRRHP